MSFALGTGLSWKFRRPPVEDTSGEAGYVVDGYVATGYYTPE
jgi:hypothetical protein